MELSLTQFADFHCASKAVMQFLYARLGFGLWMVTRTEGQEWIVLESEDHGYEVNTGDVFRWLDSYCSRMVDGLGPRIAPRSAEIPAYASAPIGEQVEIEAYIGVPITLQNGTLFGTLCAIDPEPQPQNLTNELPLVELLAGLLAKILDSELSAQSRSRETEQAMLESQTDPLTGLFNRRGWDRLLHAEEARCKRYAHSACVFFVDVDELKRINDSLGHVHGDACLVHVANVLRSAVRESDVVARVGGDEFAILSVNCEPVGAQVIKRRINTFLAELSISASIGYSIRSATTNLKQTMLEADEQMYLEKKQRKNRDSFQSQFEKFQLKNVSIDHNLPGAPESK